MKQPETLMLAHWLELYGAAFHQRGNAQLISAAPDLLEALQAGPSTFHTLPGGEVCQCSQCQFVRLRNAAIEKATNIQPTT